SGPAAIAVSWVRQARSSSTAAITAAGTARPAGTKAWRGLRHGRAALRDPVLRHQAGPRAAQRPGQRRAELLGLDQAAGQREPGDVRIAEQGPGVVERAQGNVECGELVGPWRG